MVCVTRDNRNVLPSQRGKISEAELDEAMGVNSDKEEEEVVKAKDDLVTKASGCDLTIWSFHSWQSRSLAAVSAVAPMVSFAALVTQAMKKRLKKKRRQAMAKRSATEAP